MRSSTAILATLALSAGTFATKHQVMSSYSNLETLFTTLTDSRGVITGEPTSIPPIVTAFPSSILASMLSAQSADDRTTSIVVSTSVPTGHGPVETGGSGRNPGGNRESNKKSDKPGNADGGSAGSQVRAAGLGSLLAVAMVAVAVL